MNEQVLQKLKFYIEQFNILSFKYLILDCSFNEDMCGWQIDPKHLGWKVGFGQEYTLTGGPPRDHDLESISGYYISLDF